MPDIEPDRLPVYTKYFTGSREIFYSRYNFTIIKFNTFKIETRFTRCDHHQ